MAEIIGFWKLEDIVNGTTWDGVEFEALDELGNPIDLSNKDVRIQFRRNGKDGNVAVDLSIGDGLSIKTGGDDNIIVINKMKVDWGAGNYFYDVEITDKTSADVDTPLEGTKRVLNDTTKDD